MKKFLSNLLLLFFVYLLLEGFSFFLYQSFLEKPFSFSGIQKERLLVSEGGGSHLAQALGGEAEVVHPYLGYVYDPKAWQKLALHDGIPVSSFGLIDNKSPIQKRSKEKLLIGVFGGSVAWWFQQLAMPVIEAELQKIPKFKGREIVVIRAALGGYKQPQQLLALSYLLSLGAEFDLVLNMDGYNEVALSSVNAKHQGVFPFFPRDWSLRAKTLPFREEQVFIGKIAVAKEKRKDLANFFSQRPFSWSVLSQTIWSVYDQIFVREIGEFREALVHIKKGENSQPFYATGPSYERETLFEDIAEHWRRSSEAMAALLKANGAEYFHFLQPNQYLPGTKILTKKEKRDSYNPGNKLQPDIEEGYLALQKEAEKLKENGIHFVDLTNAFKDVNLSVYSDSCCHINENGNKILGQLVADAIAASNK